MSPSLSVCNINWKPCWRLISSNYSEDGEYNCAKSTEELESFLMISARTDPRKQIQLDNLVLIRPEDRLFGSGTALIMTAFTILNSDPDGSRFADNTYGAYYAAKDIATALAETTFHRALFMTATKEPAQIIEMSSYSCTLNAQLHDVRNKQSSMPEIYTPDPKAYRSAQKLAKELRNNGSYGVVYDSVRKPGGECVAIFRPSALLPPVQPDSRYCYEWNGIEIASVYEKAA